MTCHGDERAAASPSRPSGVGWHGCQVGSGDIATLDQDERRSEIAGERPQATPRPNVGHFMLGRHSPTSVMQEGGGKPLLDKYSRRLPRDASLQVFLASPTRPSLWTSGGQSWVLLSLVSEENFSRLISHPDSDHTYPLKYLHSNVFLAAAGNCYSSIQRDTSLK